MVVLRDDVLDQVRNSDPTDQRLEQAEAAKYLAFRSSILENKTSAFFTDPRDVKLAIYESLGVLKQSKQFTGWVSGAEVAEPKPLIEEIGRLTSENNRLKVQLAELERKVQKKSREKPLPDEVLATLYK